MTTEQRSAERELEQRHAAAVATLPARHVDDLFIDGEYRQAAGRERAALVDPATGVAWGSVPIAADSDVDAAVAAAAGAFGSW
ncbi:MAG TPA: aldehyde dehydrogenase, partial [Terrimesophilobacter sp.]